MAFVATMALAAALVALAFIVLAAYVVAKVSTRTPEHLPRLFVSMAVFLVPSQMLSMLCMRLRGEGLMHYSPFWMQIPMSVRSQLMCDGYERTHRPDEAFVCRGDRADKVLIVRSGWAKIIARPEPGSGAMVDMLCEGDVCGEREALSEIRHRYDYVACGDGVSVLVVPAHNFSWICRSCPQTLMTILELTADRLQHSEQLRAADNICTRTALVLMMLCVRFGRVLNQIQTEIRLAGFTRDYLATLAGTSARSLDRAISYLYGQGILLECKGSFVIDRRALQFFVDQRSWDTMEC